MNNPYILVGCFDNYSMEPDEGYASFVTMPLPEIAWLVEGPTCDACRKSVTFLADMQKEILELLRLRVDKEKSCERAMKRAQTKLEDIENKIKILRVIKKALKELIQQCEETIPTTSCPILSQFEGQNNL